LDEILKEAQQCINIHAELSALIVSLASVDYLAGFFVGRQSTKQDYIAFMKRYFPIEYAPLIDAIYSQLRSGLMHNLVAANPWKRGSESFVIHANSLRHLSQNYQGQTIFSVLLFIEDIRWSLRMYAYDLIMRADTNRELVLNFNKRFNRLGGQGAFMVKVPD
jgi:hypothetical protein